MCPFYAVILQMDSGQYQLQTRPQLQAEGLSHRGLVPVTSQVVLCCARMEITS